MFALFKWLYNYAHLHAALLHINPRNPKATHVTLTSYPYKDSVNKELKDSSSRQRIFNACVMKKRKRSSESKSSPWFRSREVTRRKLQWTVRFGLGRSAVKRGQRNKMVRLTHTHSGAGTWPMFDK